MNGDLTNILMNFPEGIILYDEIEQRSVLANSEFKRIFKCNPDNNADLEEQINEPILLPFNLLN